MTQQPASPAFATANPHALATILDAAQTRSIIASRDIFDISGVKLWAREQPVSQALQRKLLDRQLRHPLESCLVVEKGVNARSLIESVENLTRENSPVAELIKPCAAKLVHGATHLPLHPVAQLLLTAGQAARPSTYDHAIQAMALAGALCLAHGGDTRELRLAMLCGLLHDLGEMYIDPRFGDGDQQPELDRAGWQQLVIHPHIGRLLVEQLTNYPIEVARAIAEHHERLDGSGYPNRLQRDQVSPLGRLLCVVECALGVMRSPEVPLHRASVALRVVPGEFDHHWIGLIASVAREHHDATADTLLSIDDRLTRLDETLQRAMKEADMLIAVANTAALKEALGLAQYLLFRLRTGWNASGLWNAEARAEQDAPELDAIESELHFRLRGVQRAVNLRAGELPSADAQRLAQFCECLFVDR